MSACSQPVHQGSSPALPTGAPTQRFLASMRQAGFDYEPADTPAELAGRVDAVVTGTIVDVKPGQFYTEGPGRRPDVATSVIEVEVEGMLRGDAGIVFEGSVYMEMGHPAFVGDGTAGPEGGGSGREVPFDHAAFARTVPRAYGVFFLDDRTTESYSPTIIDEGAGRPAGARITAPFIQGFLLEGEDGAPVSVMETFEAMPPGWHDLDSIDEILALVQH